MERDDGRPQHVPSPGKENRSHRGGWPFGLADIREYKQEENGKFYDQKKTQRSSIMDVRKERKT
jgi:hypothetical protein